MNIYKDYPGSLEFTKRYVKIRICYAYNDLYLPFIIELYAHNVNKTIFFRKL